jgi:acyl-CoA dehydrogenase
MKGFSASPSLKKMGWRASDTAILSFDDCYLPLSHRVGEEGSGFIALMQNFERERMLLAAYGHASAAVALAEAERYAKERIAFKRPLMGFQVTRHKLARMATLVQASRALNYQVADAMRRGESVLEQVCHAKNFACDVAQEVCDQAVQIFGGMGYMRESIVERLYRDIRILPIGGGTTEIMNEIIAKVRGYGR